MKGTLAIYLSIMSLMLTMATPAQEPKATLPTIDIPQVWHNLTHLRLQVVEPPELPPGQFCAYPEHGATPQHPCACQRKCVDVPKDGEDPSQGTTTVLQEDAKCKQYCHKEHCHCPVHNCD